MTSRFVAIAIACAGIGACADQDASSELAEAAEKARAKVEQALPEDPPANIGEALERVSKAITDSDPSVAAADLKALLPENLAGFERVSYEAERAGVGIKVSKARAEYGDEQQRLSLMITDLGAVSGLAQMGMQLFETEVDKEDESGFERTTEYKGHRSYQRMMRHEGQSLGEIMVFVNDRFTVQLDAQNVDFERMLEALDAVDIDRLLSLKQAAVN